MIPQTPPAPPDSQDVMDKARKFVWMYHDAAAVEMVQGLLSLLQTAESKIIASEAQRQTAEQRAENLATVNGSLIAEFGESLQRVKAARDALRQERDTLMTECDRHIRTIGGYEFAVSNLRTERDGLKYKVERLRSRLPAGMEE